MRAQGGSNTDKSNDPLVLAIVLMAVLFFIGWWYQTNPRPVNMVLVGLVRAQLLLAGPFDPQARDIGQKLARLDPAGFTFGQILNQLSFAGRYTRWPVAAALLVLAVIAWRWRSIQADHRRTFNIQKLMGEAAKMFPCVAPVANRKGSILDEPPMSGLWAVAQSPLHFAVRNGLLVDERGAPLPKELFLAADGQPNENSDVLTGKVRAALDRDGARELFVAQLGPSFEVVSELPDHQKGLAAAFLAFGHGDKESAQDLLDGMSLSFREGRPASPGGWSWRFPFWLPARAGSDCEVDIEGAEELLSRYADSPSAAPFVGHHASFVHVWFQGLLVFARKKGVLACSQFVWLRPMDRTLWYSLNQVGGRTAWVEASGADAHYKVEEALRQAVAEPMVDEAVVALEAALEDEGWLAAKTRPESDPRPGRRTTLGGGPRRSAGA